MRVQKYFARIYIHVYTVRIERGASPDRFSLSYGLPQRKRYAIVVYQGTIYVDYFFIFFFRRRFPSQYCVSITYTNLNH